MSPARVVILAASLLLTSALIYLKPPSRTQNKPAPLAHALANIQGWRLSDEVSMTQEMVKALKVDDYVFQVYTNGTMSVSLYVGYYLTTTKIGEPHSPLVCFEGQGWETEKAQRETLASGTNKLNLMNLLVSRGPQKELVYYWFYVGQRTFAGTFLQKVYVFWRN